jgi:hypothetical protein
MGICCLARQEQNPAVAGAGATLTLHFCDEVFASGPRNRLERVSSPGQMFGLRM